MYFAFLSLHLSHLQGHLSLSDKHSLFVSMLDFVNLTEGYESLLSVQNKIWFLDLGIKDLHKLIKPVKDQALIIHRDDSSVIVPMSRLSFILLSSRKMKVIQMWKSRQKTSSYLRKKDWVPNPCLFDFELL